MYLGTIARSRICLWEIRIGIMIHSEFCLSHLGILPSISLYLAQSPLLHTSICTWTDQIFHSSWRKKHAVLVIVVSLKLNMLCTILYQNAWKEDGQISFMRWCVLTNSSHASQSLKRPAAGSILLCFSKWRARASYIAVIWLKEWKLRIGK